jgi:hypothetical protein
MLLLEGMSRWWLQYGTPIDMNKLFRSRVVARIADIATEVKGFVIGALILHVFECAKILAPDERDDRLRHISLIKDPSMLLPNSSPTRWGAAACQTVEQMLIEMGYYGEGIILDEQFPAKLMSSTLQKTGLKIIHRLMADDDRRAISNELNLDDTTSSPKG